MNRDDARPRERACRCVCPTARQERMCCFGAIAGTAWGFLLGALFGGPVGATVGPPVGCCICSVWACYRARGPVVY